MGEVSGIFLQFFKEMQIAKGYVGIIDPLAVRFQVCLSGLVPS